MITLEIGNKEFTNLNEFYEYIASIEDIKILKKELKIFDTFILRDIYEKMSNRNDKYKLTKLNWIEEIYKINN